MEQLHRLENYSFEVLESFINNSIEESQYIEFKSGEALSKKDAHKKEISKDVSAFANADGGIIIYGISEKNHKADSFSFIDGNKFSKEWLEQIITSTIHRNIPDLKIIPVRKNGNLKETLYTVQIPSSVEAPHMCRDKRFYRRALFESIIMEEYEVRQLYGRRVKSELYLKNCKITPIESGRDNHFSFKLEADVINEGEKVENKYKVNTYLSNRVGKLRITWNQGATNHYITELSDKETKISVESDISIYPNEVANTIRFNIEIPNENLYENLKNIKVKFELLYIDKQDYMELDMKYFIDKLDKLNNIEGTSKTT